jgi:glucose-1-phosphate cytidylyltransferase
LVETGLNTMTGGRIKRVEPFIGNAPFLLTYGDGVSNIDIKRLVDFHKSHGKLATLTAIQPSGKFGALELSENDIVNSFKEKPKGDGAWINGGFFVLQPEVFKYINEGDHTIWERGPLENLSKNKELIAFKHDGFWRPMDTLRDKIELEGMWNSEKCDWKIW